MVRDYRKELKNQMMIEELKELIKIRLRMAFKRIIFARRKKVDVQLYEPQKHILHLIEDRSENKFPHLQAGTYDDFLNQIDEFVEEHGRKEEHVPITSDVIKIFKRYPNRKEDYMKMKYGNNWE